MLKTILFLSVLLLFSLSVEASQFSFEFKKANFSNTFNLIIRNTDPKRAIEFYGCYDHPVETNYYVLMKNGSKHNIDSKVFCQIGMKGRYGVNPGDVGEIPFKFKKEIIQNAERIVFKGITYIPIKNEGFIDYTDKRELIVTYDVAGNNVAFEVGKEVLEESAVKEILNGDNSTGIIGELDGISNDIEMEPYRLKINPRRTP